MRSLYAIGDAEALIELSRKYSKKQDLKAFGVSEDDIQPYIDIISVKNDLASTPPIN